jgi:hypothetical protein
MNYEPTDADVQRLIRFIGFNLADKHDGVIVEEAGEDQVYVKFMSDGGKKDDANGRALQELLTKRGVKFEADRLRSLIMDSDDFKQLFGPDATMPMFIPNSFEYNFKRLLEVFAGLGIDFTPVDDINNYKHLLDMSNPEVSQFFHDWKAYLETKNRFTATLANQLAKVK